MNFVISALIALLTTSSTSPAAPILEAETPAAITRTSTPTRSEVLIGTTSVPAGIGSNPAKHAGLLSERTLEDAPEEADDKSATQTLISLDVGWDSGDEVKALAQAPDPIPEPESDAIPPEETGTQAQVEVSTPAGEVQDGASEPSVEQEIPTVSEATRSSIVALARAQGGKAYVWGASGPSAFDCSGLVYYVFGQHGINLPRTSGAQGAAGYQVSYDEALPGDLVVWGSSHVAIYLGDGMIVHASGPGVGVVEGSLYGSYYFSRVL